MLVSPNLPQKEGFTLVELSMVLLIIGLLAGGIFVGQDLIRSAELRKLIAEKDVYVSITQQFKQRYHALPGDFTEATRFWGMAPNDGSPAADDAACAALTVADPSVGTNTCNGNGDLHIGGDLAGATIHETLRFWQHLSNAGLLEIKFTGVPGSGGPGEGDVGVNVPASHLEGAGWSVNHWSYKTGDMAFFDGNYKHTFILGGNYPSFMPAAAIISTEEAYDIDAKIDDGVASNGDIVTLYLDLATMASSTCHNGANVSDVTATYQITDLDARCLLIFRRLNF